MKGSISSAAAAAAAETRIGVNGAGNNIMTSSQNANGSVSPLRM